MEKQEGERYFYLRDRGTNQRVGVFAYLLCGDGAFLKVGVSLLGVGDQWCTRTGVDKALGRLRREGPVWRLPSGDPSPSTWRHWLWGVVCRELAPKYRLAEEGLDAARRRVDFSRAAAILAVEVNRLREAWLGAVVGD